MLAIAVDDSRAMRAILQRALTRLGFEVWQADNGRAALALLAAADRVPELALVDWNMPEMDGLRFVTEVRKRPALRGMALVMVTADGDDSQVAAALAGGANAYLIKPFTPEEFARALAVLGLVPPGVVTGGA